MALLEGLPPELRCQILGELESIATLQALVHASPVYHATYRTRRKPILLELVKRQHYTRSLVEPLFALRSISYSLWSPNRIASRDKSLSTFLDTVLENFLDSYGRACACARADAPASEPGYNPKDHAPANPRELIKLVKLQRAVAAVADDYARSNLGASATSAQLYPLERMRIARALYRLQMLSNLFGCEEVGLQAGSDVRQLPHLPSRIFSWFLARFAPWEVQEMGCMWAHIVSRYDAMAAELGVDDAWRQKFVYPVWEQQGDSEPVEDDVPAEAAALASLGPWQFAAILSLPPSLRLAVIEQDLSRFRLSFYAIYAAAELPATYKAPADIHNGTGRSDNSFLEELPVEERPSWGWVELCRKCGVPSLGIRPTAVGAGRRGFQMVLKEGKAVWSTGWAFWEEEPGVRALGEFFEAL